VQMDPTNDQIFEIWVFGNANRLLPIWPILSRTPILKEWDWSPLIHDAFQQNERLFRPSSLRFFGRSRAGGDAGVIPGLVALHIRRGDFKDHCRNLADWGSGWNGFNSFPELRDKFKVPSKPESGETTEAIYNLYLEHCYPDIPQIVNRVAQVVAESRDPLRYLYIMTNGDDKFVKALKSALRKGRRWDHIASSRDLTLTWQQKFVAHGLDMFVAQRAQLLIGNGWSSLTSNAVMLRMAHNFPPDSIRFL